VLEDLSMVRDRGGKGKKDDERAKGEGVLSSSTLSALKTS